MNFHDLKRYDYWIGKSAWEIKQSVGCTVNGWAFVFPEGGTFPAWANKVRNYFNEIPRELAVVGQQSAKTIADRLPTPGILSNFALPDGDDYPFVFVDKKGNHWFLMKPGGGVYHQGDGSPGFWDKVGAQFTDQNETVFKLVSPDGIGGSSEVIVKNPQKKNNLGNTDLDKWKKNIQSSWFSIVSDIDFSDNTRGTYNYAETLTKGFTAHDYRDIKPHENMIGTYMSSVRLSPLESRIFPENIQ
jgi:hypothetical protein